MVHLPPSPEQAQSSYLFSSMAEPRSHQTSDQVSSRLSEVKTPSMWVNSVWDDRQLIYPQIIEALDAAAHYCSYCLPGQ